MALFQKLYIILCCESSLRLFLSERNKELTLLSYHRQLFSRFGSHGKADIGTEGGGGGSTTDRDYKKLLVVQKALRSRKTF